ncbi:MAG TPA: ABC transporter ATP-binding protein [Planctomycetaceae bacterium]|jgi:ABC-2 type transport system ATP-binding protein|nr:ABC transporter ATP-binding protein [Planctomycetaceae bacterium]
MTAAFSLQHVIKQYKNQMALYDVNCACEPGTVFALLGENGAGKTTAIKILLGLLDPDSGKSTVLGLDSRRDSLEIRRRVGYVPDQPALYDWMTVDEVGWFAGGFYPPGYQRHYNELVEHFELPPGRRMKELSKGMRAKVSLSVAMAHRPELLILDEPTSGLDAMVRREFLESMVDVAAQGRTVILASHQIAEVERVADIVAILRHGKLVLLEKLDDLKDRVCELTVTLRNGVPDLPKIPGTVLHRELKGRQWRLLVRNMDESQFDGFRIAENIRSVDVRRPTLEEIFVGYMKGEPVSETPHEVPAL